ncbi:MAG TPA: GNAT family N-acetyltransferase [Polyangiaceae bacterium]|jgi:ribosomal protein S18 acetylase RimI-like enzyme|nr:GNAT family N-acetyltransferase [Polyangiaceae bacterium]
MTLCVRLATTRDFHAMAALFAEVDAIHIDNHPERFRSPGQPPRALDYLEQVLASPHQVFLVAELEGRLTGLVHVAVYEAPAIPLFVPRLTAVVSDLVVAEEHRSHGIGQRLLSEAESWARLHGASTLELSVYEFNTGARRFYEGAGYGTLSRMMSKQLR